MLEHAVLLVHAWNQEAIAEGGAAWIRRITDSVGTPLGFVRFEGDPALSWLSWLRKIRLDVFETDDASHLMTLTRLWGILRSWDVEDAEQRHVGNLYTKSIVSSDNVRLGYIDDDYSGPGRILDIHGQVLARFTSHESAIKVTFTPNSMANPFLRMLILGSILALEPMPKIHD